MNTNLLYVFLKKNIFLLSVSLPQTNDLATLTFLNNKVFVKSFYSFFKNIYKKNLGIMTINLSKSFLHKLFCDLNTCLTQNSPVSVKTTTTHCLYRVKYLQPITLVSFSFQKQTYNTLMVYIIFLLTNIYPSTQNSFKLYYSFILHSSNLNLYPFLNFFYFKLRQF